MADSVEIRVRVRDDTVAGFRDVNGRLRDLRGRFAREGDAAGRGFSQGIARNVAQATSAFGGAVGAAAALQPVIAGAVAATVSLAGAALLLPGAFAAAGAAAATLGLSLGGVGEAFTAMGKTAGGGGGGGAGAANSAARSIRDATDAVSDARRSAARVAEDTARDISRAEREVARAAVDGAREIRRAKEDQAEVYEDVADAISDAQERERAAQEALNDARDQAARTLDDLREKVSDYALDEEGARLRLLAAYAAQRKVTRDVESTNLERAQAVQNVKEAEERLSDVQRERAQDTAKLAEEEAKGVEGSDLVVAAKGRVEDAEKATAAAREDGAERIQAAAMRVAEAEESAAERSAAAEEALSDTRRDAARANEAAQEQVADALQRLKDAETDAAAAGSAGAGGINAYNAALAKLSPNARAFVEAIRDLKPAWDAMQKSVQDQFFAGFADKVRQLAGEYIPRLRDGLGSIAAAMNKMALYAADALMKPENAAAISKIMQLTASMFGKASSALGDFLDGFIQLAAIGAEYLPAFGTWLSDIARSFKDWVNTNPGKIREFIDTALANFRLLWEILGNIGQALSIIFGAGTDGGRSFLEIVRDISEKFKEWAPIIRELLPVLAALWVTNKIVTFIGWIGNVRLALAGLMPIARRVGAAIVAALRGPVGGVLLAGAGVLAADALLPKEVGEKGSYGQESRDDLSGLAEGIMDPAAALEDLKAEFAEFPENFQNSPFMAFWNETFPAWWNGLWGPDGQITGTLSDGWDWIKGVFADADASVAATSAEMFQPLVDAWNWCAGVLAAGWNWVSSTAQSVWGSISRFLGTVWNTLVNAWNWCAGVLAAGWNWVSTTAQSIWRGISNFLGTVWNALVSAWNWCEGIVVSGWNYIVAVAYSIGSRIGGAFQSGWNAIVSGAQWAMNSARNILNWIIDGVNGAIYALNVLPGPDIGYVSHFAAGGVTGGGMAVVGERGPELVRLPTGSQVIPAGQTRNMLAASGSPAGGGGQLLGVAPGADGALAALLQRMIRTGELVLTPAP